MEGKVLPDALSPLQHGGHGVGEGGAGGLVLLLPAPLPLAAADAHLFGGPVKHPAGVLVVGNHRGEGLPQASGHRPEGGGSTAQLLGSQLSPQLPHVLPLFPAEDCPQAVDQRLRLEEEQHCAQHDLQTHRLEVVSRLHPHQGHPARQYVYQGAHQPPPLPTGPGQQAGQGVEEGAVGQGALGSVHGHPRHHTGGSAYPNAPLPGGGHHGQHTQHSAQGHHPAQHHPGQGHHHRAPQYQHPCRLGWGPGAAVALGAHRHGLAVAVHHHRREGQFRQIGGGGGSVPPQRGLVDKPHRPIEKGGHQGHKPAFPVEAELPHGQGHGVHHHGGGYVPQSSHKAQKAQVAQGGAQQGAHPLPARPPHRHQGQSEEGMSLQKFRPGEGGGEQKRNGALSQSCLQRHFPPPLRPNPAQCSFFPRHSESLAFVQFGPL